MSRSQQLFKNFLAPGIMSVVMSEGTTSTYFKKLLFVLSSDRTKKYNTPISTASEYKYLEYSVLVVVVEKNALKEQKAIIFNHTSES
jgi:hypothetical protein